MSAWKDVFLNLALEEWLLTHAPQVPLLLLYTNAPCVVIGKNQNPWREARLSQMAAEGVALARRISGGGAVYHDEGNLNFSVLCARADYREERQVEWIFQTLERFGLRAARLGKTSLGIDGLKFCGQAFCFRGERVVHHGTLLVRADLCRLQRYLGAELQDIQTQAVASVPVPVANLSALAPGLTCEVLSAALAETFQDLYGGGCPAPALPAADALRELAERNRSAEWILGATPRFEVTMNGQTFRVERGRIVRSDGTPAPDFFKATPEEFL
jgi:lipoate-protein ligase A